MPSSRVDFATVFYFNDDEFEADEQIRQAEVWEAEVIGIDAIESDVAFSADLGIRAAREFKVDGERDGILVHKS